MLHGPHLEGDRVRWSIWAPAARRVVLQLEDTPIAMRPEADGCHTVYTNRMVSGIIYGFRLDGGEVLPDPCSRWQPTGVFGRSCYLDHSAYDWDEGDWKGIAREDLVLYEMHVGTFTPEGTFAAAVRRLPDLVNLGVTAVELMPVSQFSGDRGWGYDGVYPYAVQNSYGGPVGLKQFVAAAHRLGLAVILDVVYNHFGPEGNHFPRYGNYLTEKYDTPWGDTLDFDKEAVRYMVLGAVKHWVGDFRVDGLRLDSAHNMYDDRTHHIIRQIVEVAHSNGHAGRPVHVFAENDLNDADKTLGEYRLDGQWNDDLHHAAHVVLTGESSSLYADFTGENDLGHAIGRVFVHDVRYSRFHGGYHGRQVDRDKWDGSRFVGFMQNHDWVGNRPKSERLAAMVSARLQRLAAGLLLLTPRVPLLFMGEEYGETRPFPFFCDFRDGELMDAIRRNREAEVAHLGEWVPPDPGCPFTREMAVLSWRRGGNLLELYRRLLALRRDMPELRDMTLRDAHWSIPYGPLVVRRGGDVSVVFNLERDSPVDPAPPGGEVLFHSGAYNKGWFLGLYEFAVVRG